MYIVGVLAFLCFVTTGCQGRPRPKPMGSAVLKTPASRIQQTVSSQDSVLIPLQQRFNSNQTFAFILPQIPPLQGVGPVRAALCQNCHTEIGQEWQQSTHAAALRDLQYQAELSKASSPRWLCLNCHIPVQNQRKHIVQGLQRGNIFQPILRKNPGFDKQMRQEAITCAACHVRVDAQGKSYVIGGMGSKLAPHPVKQDRKFLREICLRCHDPQGERLTKHLLCWFKTREEWDKSQHSNRDCVDCHMPTRQRRLVPAWKHLPLRTSHQHHWVGGGVPKDYGGYNTLLSRGYRSGLVVQWFPTSIPTSSPYVSLHIRLQNKYAGHWLPTADPERYLLVQALLLDAKGTVLQRQFLRIGQTWVWEPMAQKVGDNRLKPLEIRDWKPRLRWPKHFQNHTARVQVYHVRLSSRTAQYMTDQATKMQGISTKTRHQIANLGTHYPLATLIYREDWLLTQHTRRIYSVHELLKFSAQEQQKPLHLRDY